MIQKYTKGMEDGYARCNSVTCGEFHSFNKTCDKCKSGRPYINTVKGRIKVKEDDYIVFSDVGKWVIPGEFKDIMQVISTGLIRRIDDLGRVVIPKEIRKKIGINNGDALDIFLSKDGYVCFKKCDSEELTK